MATLTFPTNAELNEIAQVKLPTLMENRPIFDIMPVRNVDASLVMWEQRDNYTGLQQLRGLNGQPPKVQPIGANLWMTRPGAYGEFMDIDEIQITERRRYGTFGTTISIDELVVERQDQLLNRRLDRIEQIGWNVLQGTFSVATLSGAVAHTDTYSVQTYSAGVAWATVATATPLANFRAVQLLGRGKSTNFGAGSVAYVNRVTGNNLMSNTNAADLGGRRLAGLAPANSLADINRLLLMDDLPAVQIYDEGYLNDSGTFVPFIPNSVAIVVGRRPAGQTIAEYQMTRNANNPDSGPGAYMKVIDRGDDTVPRTIEVHDGHNGGPAIMFPGSVVVMSV